MTFKPLFQAERVSVYYFTPRDCRDTDRFKTLKRAVFVHIQELYVKTGFYSRPIASERQQEQIASLNVAAENFLVFTHTM